LKHDLCTWTFRMSRTRLSPSFQKCDLWFTFWYSSHKWNRRMWIIIKHIAKSQQVNDNEVLR
jgi:hypothetical protein